MISIKCAIDTEHTERQTPMILSKHELGRLRIGSKLYVADVVMNA